MARCYCGLKTRANRWKWSAFGILLILGFLFLFAASQRFATCSRAEEIDQCEQVNAQAPVGSLEDPCEYLREQQSDCLNDNFVILNGLFLFWIMSWIGASFPLYMMCCCTERPPEERPAPEGVQMGMPGAFQASTMPPTGYPMYLPTAPGQPVQGYLATPTAAPQQQQQDDMPIDIPMYTATIK